VSGLPSLPPGLPAGLEKFLRKLGEQVEVANSDRGSPLNAKPTIQDLIDIGLINASTTQSLKANGKSFTLDNASSWLSPAMPGWFSDLENPPAPNGLTVAMNQANMVLAWNLWNSVYYGQTLVYRADSNNLSAAVLIGSTTGNTYVDNLPPAGQAYFYWIRTQSKSLNTSDYNLVSGTTVGNVAGAPSVTSVFDSTDVVLSWPTPTSALQIKYYIIRYGASFAAGLDVGTSNTNTLRLTCAFGGTRLFWVAAVDINGQLGLAGSCSVTVVPPNAPTATQTIQNDSLVLSYSAASMSLPIDSYEVRYGASFAAGTTVGKGVGTRFETAVNWTGNRTFWVAAYDTAGNQSTATQVIFAPTLPSAVALTTQVVDNNVLLSWTASTGSLSVVSYLVDRGGVSIGTIAGRFTVVFETAAGTYTYGITPIDSAGNTGTRATTSATVAQPPDYQLQSNANSGFSGAASVVTISNATPGVVTWLQQPFMADTPVTFTTTGALPSPLVAGTTYYVNSPGTDTFQLAATVGGAAINTTTAGSGVHTASSRGFDVAIDPASGGLLCNVDTNETWATHFTSRGWTTIDQQIAAGYPLYTIGKTTGRYAEIVDYGATISAAKVTMTPTLYSSNGTVTITPTVSTSPNSTVWTDFVGVYSAYSTAYRYVKYILNMTATHDGSGLATDTASLIVIQPLNYRLDVKQRTFQGMVSALSTDAGGTSVDITGQFIDVASITVSALGTTALFVVYDFVDTANPTAFKVLVFNSSGTRVSATVSYTLRGV
jgi:hypothetical protein